MSDALSEVSPGPFPQPCACVLFCTEHPVLHSTALSWGLPHSVSALGPLRDGGFIEPLWVKIDFRYRAQCYQEEEARIHL